MQKLHFSIVIDAPREQVYSKMLDKPTYQQWTEEFAHGSTYEGSWEQGAKIRFIDPSGGGMLSEIAENRPNEFVSIRHVGMIGSDGVEDTTSDAVKAWTPAFENYTFTDKDGGTEVVVDMDASDEWAGMMGEMWPHALERFKRLCEGKLPAKLTVSATVNVPIEKAWEYRTKPEHITQWAFASDTWEAPEAENDVKAGGRFRTRMRAKDGSAQFDFTGKYTAVEDGKSFTYRMDDGRFADVTFEAVDGGTRVTESFEPEGSNTLELQQGGWQAIMDNYKKYAESR